MITLFYDYNIGKQVITPLWVLETCNLETFSRSTFELNNISENSDILPFQSSI